MLPDSGRLEGRGPLGYHGAIPDTPPDRLSTNPKNPHFDQAVLERGVGVRFKGVEKTNVDEYCVSEGWVRLSLGNKVDRHGAPLTMKFSGEVEPYFKDLPAPSPSP